MTPKVEFETSRAVNEFCHFSVLYSDLMPVELANGILGNKEYKERNSRLEQEDVRLALQKTPPFRSESEWYRFVSGLMKEEASQGFRSLSIPDAFKDLYKHQGAIGFEEIWKEERPRLETYQHMFMAQWSPISDRVLSRLSELTRNPWRADKIHVHFIDSLYGGFGWDDCIGFAAFPDLEVQKKFLAHELSELITPQRIVVEALRRVDLNPEIAHTVVDMIAYFSVKDFITKPPSPGPERKGIKPNPRYYPAVDELIPFFEHHAADPSAHPDFSSIVNEMIQQLHGTQPHRDPPMLQA